MIDTVLFDLDGTLLPLDQDAFVKTYFSCLTEYMAPVCHPPLFMKAMMAGVEAMLRNNGEVTNETVFWRTFTAVYGQDITPYMPLFDAFYRGKFLEAKSVCGFNPAAAETVRVLKAKGYRVHLATNPVFPAVATEQRIQWAGMHPEEFFLYTTYENSHFSKPHPGYYLEIAETLAVPPERCLMVGNDVDDDMVAETVGMKVFLLSDCLLNRQNKPTDRYPQGSFDELMAYLAADRCRGE